MVVVEGNEFLLWKRLPGVTGYVIKECLLLFVISLSLTV